MNKMFTATAICQLAEKGRLTFDDPVIKFIPDYPNKEAAEKITICLMKNIQIDFSQEKSRWKKA